MEFLPESDENQIAQAKEAQQKEQEQKNCLLIIKEESQSQRVAERLTFMRTLEMYLMLLMY